MKLLLHVCCGPCSIVPIDRLRLAGHELTGFWFNPNVHPFTEHEKRRSSFEEYAGAVGLPVIWHPEYRMPEYLREIAGREDVRCRICYRLRMVAAAQAARENHCDAFTTTLLYSKFQKHELLAETAAAVARETGIRFHYEGFRPGWSEGVRRSKEMGMYRQQYCGCIYSEWERYRSS